MRERKRKDVPGPRQLAAEDRVLDRPWRANSSAAPAIRSQEAARRRAQRQGNRDRDAILGRHADCLKFPACRRPDGAISIGDISSGKLGGRTKTRRLRVEDSHELLVNEESDKLLDTDQLVQEAIHAVENSGIVFLDEIDKIACASRVGGDVSREGVAARFIAVDRSTTVSTKHGAVKTDHILFIASGAFHIAKPSDLLPELQGRLPIRVELAALTRDDFAAAS